MDIVSASIKKGGPKTWDRIPNLTSFETKSLNAGVVTFSYWKGSAQT